MVNLAFDVKQFIRKCAVRFKNFLYIFNLRQGAILIAIHQIALTAFALVILLVGISHVGEMMSILHTDMMDNAERSGLAGGSYGDEAYFLESETNANNNQKRFVKAQYLASVTVILLYTSTILAALYLMCCMSLLYGAIKYKKEFVAPWIVASCIGLVLVTIGSVIGERYCAVVTLLGGKLSYNIGAAIVLFGYAYSICAVCSFALELKSGKSGVLRIVLRGGERMVLLDQTAQNNILSSLQLNKLNKGRKQFV